MKILITGHTGFKGMWLGNWLKNQGHEIFGISREIRPTSIYAKSHKNKKDLFQKEYFFDIADHKKVFKTWKAISPELVFHLAAQPIVFEAKNNPKDTFLTNTIGTLNILDVALKTEITKSLVLITTDKVYKEDNNKKYVEDDCLFGQEPYSASKVAAELVINSYRKILPNSFTQFSSARAGNIIGVGDDGAQRLIPYLIQMCEEDKEILLRNPQATRPWTYILDVVSGYTKLGFAMLENKIEPGAWNFTGIDNTEMAVSEITDIFLEHYSDKKMTVKMEAANFFEQTKLNLDSSKAQKNLKWIPKFDTHQTVKAVAQQQKTIYNGSSLEEVIENAIGEYRKL